MNPQLISPLVFVSAALAVLGATSLVFDVFLRDRQRLKGRLDEEFRDELRERIRKSSLFKDLQLANAGGARAAPTRWKQLQTVLEQAGLGISRPVFLAILAATALAGALAGLLMERHWLFAGVGFAGGAILPVGYVRSRYKRRQANLLSQVPEALELMSRTVRAGQTISGALQVVANDLEAPLGEEFVYCCEQQNLGLSQEVVLRELAQRTGVLELQMLVVALLVQRQSGGNPVEVLNGLAAVTRKRLQLAGKVKALTAEGRMQAVVLSLLPVAALVALLVVNRDYAQILLDRPLVLLGMFVSEILGALWIRKIVNFES
jgi:tight adherence protein B